MWFKNSVSQHKTGELRKDSFFAKQVPITNLIFAVSVLVLSLFFTLGNLIAVVKNGGNNWGIGEWLINYNGGFIRRGLVGELILSTNFERISLLILTVSLQFFFYLIVWLYMFVILHKQNFSWTSIAVTCNPMGICFVGWDEFVLIRKEIIGLTALVTLAIYTNMKYKNKILLYVFYIFFFVAIYSSEVNLTLLPAVLFLFWINEDKKVGKAFFSKVIPVLVSVTGSFFVSLVYQGNKNMSDAVCLKLVQAGLEAEKNCRGSVDVLAMEFTYMLQHLREGFPEYFLYVFVLAFAALPIVYVIGLKFHVLLFLFTGTVPLYLVGWDYGRWIFIFVVASTICVSVTQIKIRSNRCFNSITSPLYVLVWGSGHAGDLLQNGWIGAMPATIRRLIGFLS